MKTHALLIFPVLCFATVTLGGPTLKFKGDDLTKSFDDLNAPFIDAEECFKDAEEYFQAQSKGLITSASSNLALGSKCERAEGNDPLFVVFLNPKNEKIHYFISIPDPKGKSHVYIMVAPPLGHGLHGLVYLAKDIEIPDKFVAIKETDLESEPERKGLELVGELLGSVVSPRPSMDGRRLFLVMPFVPGIELGNLAEKDYNGRRVYEYWMDEDNKGYYTLLDRIARDVVAPLMNNNHLIHDDLTIRNMMVAQIDENYLPTATDPATGLQHFRAIDFDKHYEIPVGENILEKICMVAQSVLHGLPNPPQLRKLNDQIFKTTMEIFQRDVVNALDKNKFDIKLDADGMPEKVIRTN